MTMATLATAVTAIRRHMYEATNHQVSMNRHRLAAGQQLLVLRKPQICFVNHIIRHLFPNYSGRTNPEGARD